MLRKIITASALALLVASCGQPMEGARNEAGVSFTVDRNQAESTLEGQAQLHCTQFGRDAYPAGSASEAGGKKVVHFRCLPPAYALREADESLLVLFSPTKANESHADKRAAEICGQEGEKAVRTGGVSTYQGPIKPFTGWRQAQYTCTL